MSAGASHSNEFPPEEPAILPYDDGDPIPLGYRVRRTHRTGLIISGSITFGIPYLLSVAGSGNDTAQLIPVAGPFISLITEDKKCEIDCALYAGNDARLIANGLVQTTGAVILVVGIAMEDAYLERTNTLGARILPTRIGSGYGFAAFGFF